MTDTTPATPERRGRPREYGDEAAIKRSFTCSPSLWRTFVQKWQERGATRFSRMIQAAMRYWLVNETGIVDRDKSIIIPTMDMKTASHIHLILPGSIGAALKKHGVRTGRTPPAVVREAVARYIRDNGELGEFRNLDEWKFLRDDAKDSGGSCSRCGQSKIEPA